MIQLTQSAVVTNSGNLRRLSGEFAETGCARLPGFLTPPIVKHLLAWLQTARFEIKNEVHEGTVFGTTLFVPQRDKSISLLGFVLNRPALFEAVEQVARCTNLSGFLGRIHRTNAGADQHIDWHDDATDSRVVGITIHLSREPYTGGLFQLRDSTGGIRSEIACGAPGDAFLFRIGSGWEHRLTPLESGARTVAVGWFLTAQGVKLSPYVRLRIAGLARKHDIVDSDSNLIP